MIDHLNIDRIAAEELIASGVRAVLNASPSTDGRYPNTGPLMLVRAGDPADRRRRRGAVRAARRRRRGDDRRTATVSVGGEVVLRGRELGAEELEQRAATSSASGSTRRSPNSPRTPSPTSARSPTCSPAAIEFPPTRTSFRDRQVLIVVRGDRHERDLRACAPTSATSARSSSPSTAAPTACSKQGLRPDVILGDMDSAGEAALRCGAELIVHAYPDGRPPGASGCSRLGLAAHDRPRRRDQRGRGDADGLREGGRLIVSVGAHFNLIEFLERKRGGMSSTFLTRLRIGEKLVDAKGVSRLYNPGIGFGAGGPLPRRLRDPAGDRRDRLAGAQRPRPN